MAFAWDTNTVVIATQRHRIRFRKPVLGFSGLRGTLMLSRIIPRTTGDAELAVAMARYYTLAGGTATSTPKFLRYFGLADLLVPSQKRDEVAKTLCKAIMVKGSQLSKEEIGQLKIEELPTKLTLDEKEEIRYMKGLFLQPDVVATLYGQGRRQIEIFHTSPWREQAQRVASRVTANSPNAVAISNWLISKGFDDYMKGVDLDESARYELEQHLEEVFKHPDAKIGLKAMIERKFPNFREGFRFSVNHCFDRRAYMNLKHLGDALDFWKGGLIGRLEGVLNDGHILPMFTDAPNAWTPDRLLLYAHLTGMDVSRILRHDISFRLTNRRNYFDNLPIANHVDLFVDPDTGIEPAGGGNCKYKYIKLDELARLLPESSSRILLVYQHKPRTKDWPSECLKRTAKALQLEDRCLFAYNAGDASMIFLSRDGRRLTVVRKALGKLASPLPAMSRIISLH